MESFSSNKSSLEKKHAWELGRIWELPMTYGPNQDFVSAESQRRKSYSQIQCLCLC